MAALVVAGLSKAADSQAFIDALREWAILPQWGAPAIGFALPTIEVAIGLAWILGLGRPMAALAGLVLLATLTSGFVLEWTVATAPNCSCFRILERLNSWRDQALYVIVRNAVLMGLIVVGLLLEGSKGRRCLSEDDVNNGRE